MKIERFIKIKTQIEGIHSWKDCSLKDVDFLKYPHRHIFYITAIKKVNHNNREIEIITLKREIDNYLNQIQDKNKSFGNWSCEMIAEKLLIKFNLYECEVLEDNENGGVIKSYDE